jgi:CspA family cold shock protein
VVTSEIEGMTSENTTEMHGHIKWFDPAKGFGFVVAETGGPDILLHANVLRNFGQGSVADGAAISMMVTRTDRGLQAVDIINIKPPEGGEAAPLGDMEHFTAEDIAKCPVQPARVKWFDKGKGFGFANVFGDDADIFLHVEVLRRSGLGDLATGEAVGLRAMEGKRGLMAIEICSWEAARK